MGGNLPRGIPEGPKDRVSLGFGNLYASPGDHIGHFYRTSEEWKDLVVSYHKTGLEAGDKCVYIMSPGRRQEWQEALAATGVEVDRALASGQLVLVESKDDAKEQEDALAGALAEIGEKYPLLRSGGDANWTQAHWEFEAHINTVESPRAIFLCQYDITACRGDVVLDAMKTHPICIVSSVIHQNPYYLEPEVYLAELRRRDSTALA